VGTRKPTQDENLHGGRRQRTPLTTGKYRRQTQRTIRDAHPWLANGHPVPWSLNLISNADSLLDFGMVKVP
jgi:hypothetical protein